MKCPKCGYLGFETSERCKNCGYDFSLLAAGAFDLSPEPDFTIRTEDFSSESDDVWLHDLDKALPAAATIVVQDITLDPIEEHSIDVEEPVVRYLDPEPEAVATVEAVAAAARTLVDFDVTAPEPTPRMQLVEEAAAPAPPRMVPMEPALPLFIRADDDDTPLITVPSAPRPPLAVRRTPEVPRLRAASRLRALEPALDFREEPDARDTAAAARAEGAGATEQTSGATGAEATAGRRIAAAAIDHAILFAIDLVILYFTLRMAALAPAEWRLIPPVPMAVFLGLMKFAYFSAFTAVGGQTIGKMAVGIKVVSGDHRSVDPAAACRRTLAAILSCVTLGLAYLPGLVGADRRAVHDRLAGTRVVTLPSA